MINSKKRVAIIGGGAAGFMAAAVAAENNSDLIIDVFEKNSPLKTILHTGGGRCNITNATYDFKELASYYPRGEKFLYSIFSKFGARETIEWFENRGLRLYSQDDKRVFPKSDDAKEVREFFLNRTSKLGVRIKSEEVLDITLRNSIFNVKTSQNSYDYDSVIISTGGNHSKTGHTGYEFAKKLGHAVTDLKPSLVGYITQEKWPSKLSGVSIKNVKVEAFNGKKIAETTGDILFTHNGISGPGIFRISAYCAFTKLPLDLKLNFIPERSNENFEKEFLKILDKNSKKDIVNIVSEYAPKSFVEILLSSKGVDLTKKASQITKDDRNKIIEILTNNKIKVISTRQDGEIVTAGGVNLKEVNQKTMESKLVQNLYFCGEVLDIDGLTGGFNLQAAWSTGYIAGISL